MYKKILAPVDLAHPDTAKHMVSVAKKMADAGKSEIVLLNVVPDLPGYVAAELPADILRRVITEAEEQLADIAKAVDLDGGVKVELRSGRPHSQILQVAEDIGADLIVIASHQPGFGDYLLGSVAGKVVRHAHCSVLVDRRADA